MSKIGRLISNHYNTNRVTGIYNESLAYLLGNLEEILKSSSVRNFLEVAKQGGQGFILNSVILGDVWASSLFSPSTVGKIRLRFWTYKSLLRVTGFEPETSKLLMM